MKSFIRNLSVTMEFCLVVVVSFWWGLLAGFTAIGSHLMGVAPSFAIGNADMVRWLVCEVVGLPAALWIGHIRGWSLETFGWRPSWKRTGGGVLLFLGTMLVLGVIYGVIHFLFPGRLKHLHFTGSINWLFFALACVINPIFEEVIEAGYFIYALQRRGMWVAVLASALFRVFLHAYQGMQVWLGVFPIGLIFGFVYWRWRQLWPLFVAHAIFDVMALLSLVLKN